MSEAFRRENAVAIDMFLRWGLVDADAEAAAAALVPPLVDIEPTHPPRQYVKEVRREAKQFRKEAWRLRKIGKAEEIRVAAERTLDTYFSLASRYREPMLRRFSNPERDRAEPLTLLGDLIARPDMSYDEARAASDRQFSRSSEAVARAGADWPHQYRYGNPALRSDVVVWLGPESGWCPGQLEASLSPGMMTEQPNLMLRVGAHDTDEPLFFSQGAFLLPRPDIRSHGMAYEVRWSDAQDHYRIRTGLVCATGQQLEPLRRYLEQSWAGSESDETVRPLVSRDPTIADPAEGPRCSPDPERATREARHAGSLSSESGPSQASDPDTDFYLWLCPVCVESRSSTEASCPNCGTPRQE